MKSRAYELFGEAIDQPPGRRDAWLRAQCGDDQALLAMVQRLLIADDADGLLDHEMVELAEPLVRPTPVDDADDPRLGRSYGPYTLIRVLGRGGMGVVYEAHRSDGAFVQSVALKLLLRGLDDPLALRRFEQERQILVRLQHPHIAGLLDGGVGGDGQPWYALELVRGLPINRWAEQGTDLDQRLRCFAQVCDAVQYAHQNLVLHRDLKPGNILVDTNGQVKLLDFGIAKLLDADTAIERTGTAHRIFTPDYAAPEQIAGGSVATPTDIYSLGVVLFELLTGKRPFRRDGPSLAFRQAITDVDAEAPSRVLARDSTTRGQAAALRGDLDTIVLKCLDRDPQRRYASAAALQRDIERYLDGMPIDARADTLGYRLGKFVRRHRAGSALAAVAILGLLLTTAASVLQSRRADAEAMRASNERDIALAEARHQEAISEHFGAVLNRAVASGDQIDVSELMKWAADPRLLGDFGDARMQLSVSLAVSDLLMQRNDFPAARTLLEELVPRLVDASPRDRIHALSNLSLTQTRTGALTEAQSSADAAQRLLPEGDQSFASAELHQYRAQILRARGDLEGSRKIAIEAAAWAEAAVDASALSRGKVIGSVANALLQLGDLDAAIAHADTALRIWRENGVSQNASMPSVSGVAANARFLRGDILGALAQLDALADGEGASESIPARAARDGTRAKALALLARREAGEKMSAQAVSAMCDTVGEDSFDCLRAHVSAVDTLRIAGAVDASRQELARVDQLLAAQPNPPIQAIADRNRSIIDALVDPRVKALDAVQSIVAVPGLTGIAQRNAVRALLILAEQLDAASNHDGAARCAQMAIDTAAGLDERGGMDQALLHLWRARFAQTAPPPEMLDALALAIGANHPWVIAHTTPALLANERAEPTGELAR